MRNRYRETPRTQTLQNSLPELHLGRTKTIDAADDLTALIGRLVAALKYWLAAAARAKSVFRSVSRAIVGEMFDSQRRSCCAEAFLDCLQYHVAHLGAEYPGTSDSRPSEASPRWFTVARDHFDASILFRQACTQAFLRMPKRPVGMGAVQLPATRDCKRYLHAG